MDTSAARSPDPSPGAQAPGAEPRLCVNGIFRSGTNFFRALMEGNFRCTVSYDDFGWKHSFFPIATKYSSISFPDVPIVLLTKNPLYSLASLYSYARSNPKNIRSSAGKSLGAFLRSPVIVFDGSNPQSAEYRFSSAVEYWNAMNWSLFSAARKRPNGAHVRYEDLLAAPEATLTALAERHRLQRTTADFVVPSKRLNNLPDRQHDQEKFFSSKDFTPDDYLGIYAERDLRFVARTVSVRLMRNLGYGDIYEDRLAPLRRRA
jgi:hypothetical protein